MGEKHQYYQQNRGEIFPGELGRSGTCNTIRVDISTTRHLGHMGRVRRSGENNSVNHFASSFLRKDENPLTHSRISKYDASQQIRTVTSESSDVIKGEIPK